MHNVWKNPRKKTQCVNQNGHRNIPQTNLMQIIHERDSLDYSFK